jgi:LmbE family N-acetylglucosaminyl deacetylase
MAHSPLESPLADSAALPLVPASAVAEFGRTLVVAPHPDDESLGCGGAIALLRERGLPVHVLFVSDGSGSHPQSRAYPPEVLTALREREALNALAVLDVAPVAATFLRLPDRFVPRAGSPEFDDAALGVRACIERFRPATILLPWRRDPHGDHRAAWELVTASVSAATRLIEYPIWVWELGARDDAPRAGEVHGWRLDISGVLTRKRAAIASHVSQTTDLIADDPDGFRLTPGDLRHFELPYEIFLESGS